MSDATELSEPETQTVDKPKKQLSAEKIAQLQKAREKALEKRRLLAELSKKEKQMKEDALKQRMERVKEFEQKTQKSAPVTVPKRKKPPPPPPSDSESDESSSEEEESSDSSSDDEPVYVPARKHSKHAKKPVKPAKHTTRELTAEIAREELQRRIARENMQVAFSSLFPGYRMMH